MIVTITPSPAIDWTVTVDSFELDAVNRIVSRSREASGKGLNVSWALHRAGIPTTAVFPAGAESGAFMRSELEAAAMPYCIVETGREVRTNITLVSPGHSTKINEPGTPLDPDQAQAFRAAITKICTDADVALLCGSLPPGMDDSFAAGIVADLGTAGVSTVVDTSGPTLRAALAARPRLIKPNVDELAELVGRPLGNLGDVEGACRLAMELGAQTVLASLGAGGAMFVSADGSYLAKATNIPFLNSVGAGDALLSGFVAGGATARERLANAVLWASSAVSHKTTLFPIRPEFADRITVTSEFCRAAALAEP